MGMGISLTSGWNLQQPTDGPVRMIERAAAAYEAGLEFLNVGDHHNMGSQYAQNVPMMGRLLAEWTDRPAGPLFLLPLWHPLLVAEHIGTLAALHPARLIVQVGVGRDPAQFGAMGQDISTRGARTHDMIGVVQQLLAGETVDRPDLGMVEGRVGLLPSQPVEWWIGSGVPVGIARAATLGDCWYAGPGYSVESVKPAIEFYRKTVADAGETGRVVVRKDVLCRRNGDQAREQADELLGAGYRGLGPDQVMVGGVDDVADQIEAWMAADVDDLAIRCMAPDQESALETIELLGQMI